MAYDNVWDDTAPIDESDADQLGQDIRTLKLDIHQRLNSLIGVAIDTVLADPLVDPTTHSVDQFRTELDLLNVLLTTKVFNHYIPGIDCIVANTTGQGPLPVAGAVTSAGIKAANWDAAAIDLIYPIKLPVGSIITAITTYAKKSNTGSAINGVLYKTQLSTAGDTSVATLSTPSDTAIHANAWSLGGSQTMADDYVWAIVMTLVDAPTGDTNTVVGHKITYTSPSAQYRL